MTELKTSLVEDTGLPDEQQSELEKSGLSQILSAVFKEFRARCTLYSSIQERNVGCSSHGRIPSSARWSKGYANSPGKVRTSNSASHKVKMPTGRPRVPQSEAHQSTDLADALLHNDPRPGYAGPGIVWLDNEGTLGLAREFPGMCLCLKISYVDEVDPIWNIPLRVVSNLKGWLNRQFLAAQGITPMPKLNRRAITTLAQIWELLAQFDADVQHKSAFIRGTPIDLAFKKPIVEASVIFQTRPTQVTTTSPEVDMITNDVLANGSEHVAYVEGQKGIAPEHLPSRHHVFSKSMEMSLQCKIQAQQAEIARLMSSITCYSSRIRTANREIRSLKNELRDSQNLNRELQQQYNMAKRGANWIALSKPGAEALTSDLTMICPDSVQQASDLSDEILAAARNLVTTVEANAVIRPGITERTLQDLQLMVDMLEETAKDVKDEPVGRHGGDQDDDEDPEHDSNEETDSQTDNKLEER